jgi:hypothetical protein
MMSLVTRSPDSAPSSGRLSADVSEEHVSEIGVLPASSCFFLALCSVLKMEAACSSETSADFLPTTWCYVPEGIKKESEENLKRRPRHRCDGARLAVGWLGSRCGAVRSVVKAVMNCRVSYWVTGRYLSPGMRHRAVWYEVTFTRSMLPSS